MKKLLSNLIVLSLVVSLPSAYAETGATPAVTNTQQQSDSGLRAGHPDAYTVVKGDTLWGIAGRFLSMPWLWEDLWQMNPDIKNPHLIYPGDTVKLIYVDGKPRLTVDRGIANKDSSTCSDEPTEKVGADGVVKLLPKCRALSLESAIPTISLNSIAPFLSANRIATKEELSNAPVIVDGPDGRVVGGEGDAMFVRGRFDVNAPTYTIGRVGKTYTDPVSNEVLGLEVQIIGRGEVESPGEKIAKIKINRTRSEVKIGDILLPALEIKVESMFVPKSPERDVEGRILNIPNSVSSVGLYDTVLISKGEREGLNPGSVLAIYKEGAQVKDPETGNYLKMPSEKAGLLLVFRTFEKLSYGIVMEAERPLSVGDKLKNP
jgi:nucleoid-associated protein YgaU